MSKVIVKLEKCESKRTVVWIIRLNIKSGTMAA